MSYRIQYGPPQKGEPADRLFSKGAGRWIAIAMLAAVIVFILASPQATAALRGFLFPGDPEVTQAAFSEFIQNIKGGDPVGQAVTTFCREIIESAPR